MLKYALAGALAFATPAAAQHNQARTIGGALVTPATFVALMQTGDMPHCLSSTNDARNRKLMLISTIDVDVVAVEDRQFVGAPSSYGEITLIANRQETVHALTHFQASTGRAYGRLPGGFLADFMAADFPYAKLTPLQGGPPEEGSHLAEASRNSLLSVSWQACMIGRNRLRGLPYDPDLECSIVSLAAMMQGRLLEDAQAQRQQPVQQQQGQRLVQQPMAGQNHAVCVDDVERRYGHDARSPARAAEMRACDEALGRTLLSPQPERPPAQQVQPYRPMQSVQADQPPSTQLQACYDIVARRRDSTPQEIEQMRANCRRAHPQPVPMAAAQPVPPGMLENPQLEPCQAEARQNFELAKTREATPAHRQMNEERLRGQEAACRARYQPVAPPAPLPPNTVENPLIQPCLEQAEQEYRRDVVSNPQREVQLRRRLADRQTFCRQYPPVRTDVDELGRTPEERAGMQMMQRLVDEQRRRTICGGISLDPERYPGQREALRRQYSCPD